MEPKKTLPALKFQSLAQRLGFEIYEKICSNLSPCLESGNIEGELLHQTYKLRHSLSRSLVYCRIKTVEEGPDHSSRSNFFRNPERVRSQNSEKSRLNSIARENRPCRIH